MHNTCIKKIQCKCKTTIEIFILHTKPINYARTTSHLEAPFIMFVDISMQV